jgi:hypothetical protein
MSMDSGECRGKSVVDDPALDLMHDGYSSAVFNKLHEGGAFLLAPR